MACYFGDTHGNFQYVKGIFRSRRKTNYIHVGDFGMLFNTKNVHNRQMIESINHALQSSQSVAYVNRGNHDNPGFWLDDGWSMSNIKFVPDYSLINIEGKNTLFLGGAISIDRLVLGKDQWWPNEGFHYDQAKIDKLMQDAPSIDVVVSHTAPEFAFPIGINSLVLRFAANDPKLVEDLAVERKQLGDVYRLLNTKFKIKRWVYGHFHIGNHMSYNGTEFSCIGVNSYTRNEY
jgi:hypothetical protein